MHAGGAGGIRVDQVVFAGREEHQSEHLELLGGVTVRNWEITFCVKFMLVDIFLC